MEPREKHLKVTMPDKIHERANKILCLYLTRMLIIPEITADITYMQLEKSYWICNWNKTERREWEQAKKKLKEGGNRRECKLKAERNERAEARCSSHNRKQTPSSKAAKHKSTQKEKETDHHERTWNKSEQ